MKNNEIAALIIAHNPPEILYKTIKKLFENDIYLFIIDNSDNEELRLQKYNSDLINYHHIDNNSLYYSLNYGITEIQSKLNPDFIMILEDDNDLAGSFLELKELCASLKNSDLIIMNDRSNSNGEHTLLKVSKKLIGINTYFAKSELFYNIPFREEFFMDQGDYDFQINVRKNGGDIYITSWQVIDRLIIGRGNYSFTVLPFWRNYLLIRNSTVLFLEKKLTLFSYFTQFAPHIKNFTINIIDYGLLKFVKIALEGLIDGKNRNFNNNKVITLRSISKK